MNKHPFTKFGNAMHCVINFFSEKYAILCIYRLQDDQKYLAYAENLPHGTKKTEKMKKN